MNGEISLLRSLWHCVLAFAMIVPLGSYAQPALNDQAITLQLEMAQASGSQVSQGGILYDGDFINGVLHIDEKKWDGKSRYYCYVFHYSENVAGITLAYPLEGADQQNLLPFVRDNGKMDNRITLFEGVISPPFGRDNFVLVLTEKPIQNISRNFNEYTRAGNFNKQELLKLIKGSRLSAIYQEGLGAVQVKTLQIETRPATEKKGLTKGNAGLKTVFVINDSAEIFYTPFPQKDIVRDSFPTIEIIDPSFDTSTKRGLVLKAVSTKKIMMRGIAVDWKRGIRRISVNQQNVTTYRETSGYFDFIYEPREGINIAEVAVENKQGYTRIIRLKFHYQPEKEIITAAGKDHLLVIGINHYQEWPLLKNARKDAADFCQMMINQFGYKKENIKELYNDTATRRNIYAQLRTYVNDLSPNDRLLIYFSGHGFYDSTLDMGYWIPTDAGQDASDQFLNNLEITRMIQKMKAKNIFVIADACYSGQLLRDMKKENSTDYKSRMVLCSGKLQPVSDGVPGTNSPFARQVLGYFQQASTPEILATDLIEYVKKSFTPADKQKPVGGAIDEVGDENGDFIFRRSR